MTFWKKEPVMTSQLAGVVVAGAAVFGLKLSLEEAAALVTLIGLVVSLIARSQVTPVSR